MHDIMIVTHSSRLQRPTALVSNYTVYGSSDEDGEGEEGFTAGAYHTDAAAAMDVLMRYFEQCQQVTEDDIQPLSH